MPTTNSPNELVCQIEDGARIAIIGLGGIGCVVLRYLAVFLNSLGCSFRLCLIDGDTYTPKNASRQIFGRLGKKAEVQAEETLKLLGPSSLSIIAVSEYITASNIAQLLQCDYVFMCVDDHSIRRLVSEHLESSAVQHVVLFSGGNDGYDPPQQRGSYGNVQVYVKRDGKSLTPSITRFHPEIANAIAQASKPEESCGQIVNSVPQILFTNVAVASAMLNAFLAYTCGALTYSEVNLDTIEARMLPHFLVKLVG